MAAPDFTTDVGKVRLLISDVDPVEDDRIFNDTEIETFLAIEGGELRHAAAAALETMASNEALVFKKIRAGRLIEVDGTAVAASLLERAATLRGNADEDGTFAIADGSSTMTEEMRDVALLQPDGIW